MAGHYEDSRHEETLGQILDALEHGDPDGVRPVLQGMHPAEIALVLESLPGPERDVLREGPGGTVLAPLGRRWARGRRGPPSGGYQLTRIQWASRRSCSSDTPLRRSRRPSPSVSTR